MNKQATGTMTEELRVECLHCSARLHIRLGEQLADGSEIVACPSCGHHNKLSLPKPAEPEPAPNKPRPILGWIWFGALMLILGLVAGWFVRSNVP